MASNTIEKDSAEETILSLLCGDEDPWTFGDNNQCSLTFNRDSTGAISCGEGMRTLIAAEFDWQLTQPIPTTAPASTKPDNTRLKLTIKLTLTTRLHPMYNNNNRNPWLQADQPPPPTTSSGPVPWAPLTPSAFQPTAFTLTLDQGRFIEPFHAFHRKPFPLFQADPYRFAPARYAHRLTFDSSPFPAREAWVPEETGQPGAVKACLEYCRFWEYREFVRGRIPKNEETWAETLSLGWWLSSTTGEAHARRG